MGPYYLTALTTLLGPVQRVTGSARISFPQRTITSEPLAGTVIDVEVPTHVAGLLEFHSGAVVTLTTSFDVVAHRLPNIEIYGSEGTLVVPDPNTFGGPILLRGRGEEQWREMPLEFGYAGSSRGLGVSDMVSAIANDREHRANDQVAYHVLDLMHSILEASESGCHVKVASEMGRPAPLPQGLLPGRVELV
jgi:predicted dehydrogenase